MPAGIVATTPSEKNDCANIGASALFNTFSIDGGTARLFSVLTAGRTSSRASEEFEVF